MVVAAQAHPALHRKCLTGVTRSNSSGNNHNNHNNNILLLEVPPSFTLQWAGCGFFPWTWLCGDDWAGHPRRAPRWGGLINPCKALGPRGTCGSTVHPNQFFPCSHFSLGE